MLYPAHAAAVLAIARLHNLLASLALVLCSAALTELLPPMDFPRPTGPHGVGRLSVELVDRSRAGWLVGDDGPRRVPVDVYYPAQPTPRLSASARWCGWVPKAILGPLVRNFKLPPFLFNNLAATQTWAREAVPPVQPAAGGSWRLVLFSHSLTGVRFQNSALCAELASHGCVVAAVEHPYEAMLSLFADGTVAPYRFVSHLPPGLTPAGLLAFREQCVAYRADDLAVVHAALLRASTKGDQHGSGDGAWPGVPQAEGGEALVLLEGLLAPRSRASVIGHSCGGGGAALYAQRAGPERVRSALLLDGFVWWLGRARVAAGLRVPLLSLRTTKFLNDNDEFCVCNDELLDKLGTLSTQSLIDGLWVMGWPDATIEGARPLGKGQKACGRAVTLNFVPQRPDIAECASTSSNVLPLALAQSKSARPSRSGRWASASRVGSHGSLHFLNSRCMVSASWLYQPSCRTWQTIS